jgi:hypothetical protein
MSGPLDTVGSRGPEPRAGAAIARRPNAECRYPIMHVVRP